MRIVVPYTRLRPICVEALHQAGVWADYVDVSGDQYAYWRLVAALWREGRDFMLLEHDIVIVPEVVPSFEECPHPWCVYPYEIRGGAVMNSFGCVRFRGEFVRHYPIFDRGRLADPVRWQSLDSTIEPVLMERVGHTKHTHQPKLKHLYEEPSA